MVSYHYSYQILSKSFGFKKDEYQTIICGGIISGFFTVLFTNPVEVIRARIYTEMVKPGGKPVYSNPFMSLIKIASTEGMLGLYKGFWPNLLQRQLQYAVLVSFIYGFTPAEKSEK